MSVNALNPAIIYNIVKAGVKKKTGSETIKPEFNSALYNKNILADHYIANFKGFNSVSKDYGMPMYTSFFRDIKTLELATDTIKHNFPEGAAILDYACSDGEEALSILALLDGDDENKYDIVGLDKSGDAIVAAKKGRYREAIGVGDEGFLFNPFDEVISKDRLAIKKKFCKIMDETTRTDKRIFGYTVKEKYKNKIKFEPCENGNIFDVGQYETEKPVGAIFFRNALYQLFGKKFHPDGQVELDEIKKPQLVQLVTGIYDKLALGGIFVLGSCSEDSQMNRFVSDYIKKEKADSFIPMNQQNSRYASTTVWMKVK